MTDDDERVQVNAYTRRKPVTRTKAIESIAPKEGDNIVDAKAAISDPTKRTHRVNIITQHPAK